VRQVEVQETTFERLKLLAEPFVDTPDTVISRALDAYEGAKKNGRHPPTTSSNRLVVDPKNLPRLTHTKLITAKLGTKDYPRANWNSMLDEMMRVAGKQGLRAQQIQGLTGVNVKSGKKTDEGYTYLDDVNLSVQGQDANAACRGIVAIARNLKMPVHLEFMWRDKDGAAHPGKMATLELE
jgi:hypothetical protein